MEFALLKIGEWSRFKADATYIQPSFRLQARTGYCQYQGWENILNDVGQGVCISCVSHKQTETENVLNFIVVSFVVVFNRVE